MRRLTLLSVTCAAVALSACSHMPWGKGDDAPTPAEAAKKAAPADTATPTPAAASAQEEREMTALMGKGAATEATTTSSDTPDTASADATADTAADTAADAATDAAPAPDLNPAAAPATGDDAAPTKAAMDAATHEKVAGAPAECPGVEVLPDTKSITYFDDPEGKPLGDMLARPALVDIKGGCDYTADGAVVDIDIIMQGHITDKGRYQGRKDLEAFMTFPYFVAIMDPNGKMVDKKIMATAMRFKPDIDDLDHAEKITQTIPMANIADGAKYTITVGFQLNRAQLDYNRGTVTGKPSATDRPAQTKAGVKKDPVPPTDEETKTPVKQTSDNATAQKAGAKKDAEGDTPDAPKADTETAPKTAPASGGKMKPIVD